MDRSLSKVELPSSRKRLGDDWKKLRALIRGRDNYTCQWRGRGLQFLKHDVHHIIPWTETQDDDYDNLITLCLAHHRIADAEFRELKMKGVVSIEVFVETFRKEKLHGTSIKSSCSTSAI